MAGRFLLLIIFTGFSLAALAQNKAADCTRQLNRARDSFTKGHPEEVPALLGNCLKSGFTDNQKIEAYRLLTITYLYLDDPFAAEKAFLDLLSLDPEYRVLDTDPVEFKYLSNQYITTPIISWTARAGINYSLVQVIYRNTITDDNASDRRYNTRPGFNFIGMMDLHFNKAISLAIEADISMRSLAMEETVFRSTTGLPGDDHQLLTERSDLYVSVPVSLKFTYPGKTYYPYIYGGYSPSYNLTVNTNMKRLPAREIKVEGPGLNLARTAPDFSHSLVFGIGLKRRFRYKYVLIDLRYRLGLTNMLDPRYQFDFSDEAIRQQYFRYLQPFDDFRWSDFQLTIGFVWPQYKPRHKDEVTIQTVIGNIFSKKEKKKKKSNQ